MADSLLQGEGLGGVVSEINLNGGSLVIGDNGAKVLAEFLKLNESLKRLYIGSCDIGPIGFKFLADAIRINRTLQFLTLGLNGTTSEGNEALIAALNQNVCLTGLTVNVSNARIRFLTETRNAILIPAAVRRASLCIISFRRHVANAGVLAIFPKEIVKLIAVEVWESRKDPKWLEALSEGERMGPSDEELDWGFLR